MELLFKTLETQQYVLPPPKPETVGGNTPPGVNPPLQIMQPEKIPEVIIPMPPMAHNITTPTLPVQVNGSTGIPIRRESRKSESEKDDKDKRPRSR